VLLPKITFLGSHVGIEHGKNCY